MKNLFGIQESYIVISQGIRKRLPYQTESLGYAQNMFNRKVALYEQRLKDFLSDNTMQDKYPRKPKVRIFLSYNGKAYELKEYNLDMKEWN
jgi:hypothetical protein